jgi:hypothetical protein
MPSLWNTDRERDLLLSAMKHADFKPNKAIWAAVAQELGGAMTASAVSYV